MLFIVCHIKITLNTKFQYIMVQKLIIYIEACLYICIKDKNKMKLMLVSENLYNYNK